jgi:hypothetical protein
MVLASPCQQLHQLFNTIRASAQDMDQQSTSQKGVM